MKKTINEKNAGLLLGAAMMVLLVTALLPIFGLKWSWLPYAYAAGAALTLVAQVLMPNTGTTLRERRLARINVWSAVLYCVSAACLFIPDAAMQKSWVAFLLAGAVLQLYATLMLSRLQDAGKTKKPKN
jgi:hypothetical protein